MQKRLWTVGAPLALAALVFLLYLFASSRSTLWDRDEPRFAAASAEMLSSGNYLYPIFNGNLRPDKPILIYWLMTLPLRWWGPTELACRFFSVLGTVAVCVLTYLCGRRLFSAGAGLWAMAIVASTPMMAGAGTAATADAVLLACITAAATVFLYSLRTRFALPHALLLALALGAALLDKGPVGLAVALPAIAGTWWFARGRIQPGRHGILNVLLATLAACFIFLCWAVPADRATGGEFLRQFLGHHVGDRMTMPLEHHGGNLLLMLPFYVPVLVVLFLPWTLFLPGALSALLGRRLAGTPGKWFLLSWLVPLFVIMSLVATKLPHYILPVWPALALAVAGTIDAHERGLLNARDYKWLRRGAWLAAPFAFVMAVLLLAGPATPAALQMMAGTFRLSAQFKASLQACTVILSSQRWPCAVAGAGLAIVAVLVLWQYLALRIKAAAIACFAGTVGLQLFCAGFILPAVEKLKITEPLARAIRSRVPDAEPVVTCGYSEPSLNFYLHRRVVRELPHAEAVIEWAKEAQPGVLIVPREVLVRIQRRHGVLLLQEIASAIGFNYPKGKWCELVAMHRGP